jgi:hypothetical protein
VHERDGACVTVACNFRVAGCQFNVISKLVFFMFVFNVATQKFSLLRIL